MAEKSLAQAKRLSPEVLPEVPLIGNDQVLRGSTPKRVVKDLLAALQLRGPGPKPSLPRVYFLTGEVARGRAASSMARHGADPAAIAGTLAQQQINAIYLGKTIVLSPHIAAKLGSKSMVERMAAARTIAHEWSHHLNAGVVKFTPLEEGLAEHHADCFVSQELGVARADLPDPGIYPNFKDAFGGVARLSGGTQRLEELLRSGQNPTEVLRGVLLARGVEFNKVETILGYHTRRDDEAAGLVEALRSIP